MSGSSSGVIWPGKTVVKCEYLSQVGRSLCRDLNRRPPEYDEGMLACRS